MKIKNLRLTNFRCFDSLNVQFEKQLTVLAALNGGGKSTLLDAIAIGLGPFLTRLPKVKGISPKETDFRVLPGGERPPYMRIELETYEGLSWDRITRRDKTQVVKDQKGLGDLNSYADSLVNDFINGENPTFPVIIYYGTGRGVFDAPQRRTGFQKDFTISDSYRNALEAKANFKQFFGYFYYLEDLERRAQKEHRNWDYQQPELAVIRESISRMMPDFKNPRSELRPLRFLVDWEHESVVQQLRIEQLSDGYRTTLAMVMDIAARMAGANPLAKNILDSEGVVLIDEVDLHLHPKWQQTILPDLMRTFPRVQFIVSTHSPQVISTVEWDSIRVLTEGEVHYAPKGTKGAEASRILKRVLGVDVRPPEDENTQLLNSYLALVYADKWEDKKALSKRVQLDDIYAGEEPELTKADLYIENRKWELEIEKDQ